MPRLRKADFPAVGDLADVPGVDAYDAVRALSVLWRLCRDGLAKVYIPAGFHGNGTDPQHWNVWLEITARRVELRAWVREWLASQEDSQDGQEGEVQP